jgi:hypothetical protein
MNFISNHLGATVDKRYVKRDVTDWMPFVKQLQLLDLHKLEPRPPLKHELRRTVKE